MSGSFLDSLLGIREIFSAGVELITRRALDFVGDLQAEDDADNGRTRITLNAQASSLSSAASMNLGASPGMFVRVSAGAVTSIASFGTAAAGLYRIVTADAALTLEHSSALQLPGATNTALAANDTIFALSLGEGDWRVLRVLADAGEAADHGALAGLADDDHAQYSRVDGTRAFSAVVAGVTPTSSAHLATKGYVDGFIPLTQRGAADGVATLDSGSKIPTAQLPALAITDAFPVASQAAMLALTAQVGDVAIRSDLNKSFILSLEPASTLGNWLELLTPTDMVLSVAGRTGAVTIAAADIADSTSAGRALLTAADVAAQNALLNAGALSLLGRISPSISADQNDWNPTGLSGASRIHVTLTGASRSITGLQGGVDGRIIYIHNDTASGFDLTLVTETTGTASSAANRFGFITSQVLGPKTGALLIYDGTASRWRMLGSVKSNRGDISETLTGTTQVDSATADFQFLGTETPAQITSGQNNYALGAAVVRQRVSSDAARTITGLTGGLSGRFVVMQNVGSFPILLEVESASSTAANRFAAPNNTTIPAGGSIALLYDGTASRWRLLTHAAAPSFQTLSASTSTVTYDVRSGLCSSVTLSSGVSSTFTINFTNLIAGMRGSIAVTTAGTVDLANIQIAGTNSAYIPSGAIGSLLSDNDVAVLEWFYDGTNLYVWRATTGLAQYAA